MYNEIHEKFERYIDELTNAGLRQGPKIEVRRVGNVKKKEKEKVKSSS
jgi:hypothetical protein